MIGAFTVAQIRASEREALDRTAEGRLMRQAAGAVAVTVVRELQARGVPLLSAQVLLLVGPGNNGGDALYAGVDLVRRGLRVLAVVAVPDKVHEEAWRAYLQVGGVAVPVSEVPRLKTRADAIVDGMIGIGARLPLAGTLARLAEVSDLSAIRVAIDVPSGVDPDTGCVPGPAFTADVTVTFGGLKQGLLVSDRVGRVEIVDLDMAPPDESAEVFVLTDTDLDELLPDPSSTDDKFSGGVAGIVAGSDQYPGAAVLATGAAVRLRPGLVRYAGPQAAAVLARWPEVIACAEPHEAGQVQAWVVGPGLGTDQTARERLETVLTSQVPVLIDADGLTLLAPMLDDHPGLLRHRPAATVLTPHDREFARLFPDLSPQDRLTAARQAALRCGAVVLLKGSRTVIAGPDGRAIVNTTGSGWLATAGSGDVLSGVIGSLLATGADPLLAAAGGAHLHGRAGERAADDRAAGAQELWSRLR